MGGGGSLLFLRCQGGKEKPQLTRRPVGGGAKLPNGLSGFRSYCFPFLLYFFVSYLPTKTSTATTFQLRSPSCTCVRESASDAATPGHCFSDAKNQQGDVKSPASCARGAEDNVEIGHHHLLQFPHLPFFHLLLFI